MRRTSAALERARTYVLAAQQALDDVADDAARGCIGRTGKDLRLLEQLCAMVDELSGLAARVTPRLRAEQLGRRRADNPIGAIGLPR